MTDYLHHVPGRLRVRSRSFRCSSAERSAMLRRLRGFDGVRSVRHNAKAGSVTVVYDSHLAEPDQILAFINDECLKMRPVRPVAAPTGPRKAERSTNLTSEIGRIALSALVSRGVSLSLNSLLGVRA